MRKKLALTVAAVLVMGAAALPAQGASTAIKVNSKCTTKLALTKVNGAKLYCGKNTVAKTVKKYKLAWIKSVECYDGIVAYRDTEAQYQQSLKDFEAIKAKMVEVSKIDDPNLANQLASLKSSVANLETTMATIAPVAQALKENIVAMCP